MRLETKRRDDPPGHDRGDITLSTEGSQLQYRGDLAETALPEMLYSIDRYQVPGIVEASRDGMIKRVYIEAGNVVQASSNDMSDSLGDYLLRSGKLSPEDYEVTKEERRTSHRQLGALLVERRLLTPEEVYVAIRRQAEEIVWSLFEWNDGEVVFILGRHQDVGRVRIQLPMRQVILGGIKRAPDAKTLMPRLGSRQTVFEPDYRLEALIDLALSGEEYELLQLVDGKRTLYELCTRGPLQVADNAKLIYAFHTMQLIRRAKSPSAPAKAPGSGAIKIQLKTQGDQF